MHTKKLLVVDTFSRISSRSLKTNGDLIFCSLSLWCPQKFGKILTYFCEYRQKSIKIQPQLN